MTVLSARPAKRDAVADAQPSAASAARVGCASPSPASVSAPTPVERGTGAQVVETFFRQQPARIPGCERRTGSQVSCVGRGEDRRSTPNWGNHGTAGIALWHAAHAGGILVAGNRNRRAGNCPARSEKRGTDSAGPGLPGEKVAGIRRAAAARRPATSPGCRVLVHVQHIRPQRIAHVPGSGSSEGGSCR